MTEQEATARAIWGLRFLEKMSVPDVAVYCDMTMAEVRSYTQIGYVLMLEDKQKRQNIELCGRKIKY